MLNITIDKVRHIEDKDANVRETLVELQHALDKSEQERHFYDALCIDYTAAYLCDLMADTMTVIKKNLFSHQPLLEELPVWQRYNAILNGYGILIILLS